MTIASFVWCDVSSLLWILRNTLVVGAADMTAAFRLALAVSQATMSDTSALKTSLVSGGVPADAVSVRGTVF